MSHKPTYTDLESTIARLIQVIDTLQARHAREMESSHVRGVVDALLEQNRELEAENQRLRRKLADTPKS
jgi:regulator of replication initiation timing